MGWPKGVPFSAEHRAKMSASRRGVPKSAEHAARIAAANRGRHHSLETRQKIAAIRRGTKLSEETKRKISAIQKGRKLTAEWAANIAAGQRGKVISAEQRALLSALNKGKKLSAETRAKIGAAGRGRPASFPNRRFHYRGAALRSSWELRCAQALDALGIEWQFECRRFDLGSQTYAPDFYLPADGAFWEVKGYFGPKSQVTVALFREKYPEIPLVLVTGKVLLAIERAAAARAA